MISFVVDVTDMCQSYRFTGLDFLAWFSGVVCCESSTIPCWRQFTSFLEQSFGCNTRQAFSTLWWIFLRPRLYADSFWVFQFHMMTFMIITGIQTSSWLLVSRYGTSGRACASEMHQLALPGWLRKEGRLSSKLGVVFTSLILINTTMIYCA